MAEVGGVVLRWGVEPSGYQWVEPTDGYDLLGHLVDIEVPTVDQRGPWLIPARDHTAADRRPPRVHEERGDRQPVYRAFAALVEHVGSSKDLIQQAIVDFAGRYGHLGTRVEVLRSTGEGTWSGGLPGESLGRWCREIVEFCNLFNLAELVRKRDGRSAVQLGQQLRWYADRSGVEYNGPYGWRLIASKTHYPGYFRRLSPDRPFDTAWFHLSRRLTEELQNSLSVVVPPVPNTAAFYTPRTLRDAIYLQLHYATIGHEPGRQCQNPKCLKWYPMESQLEDGAKRKKRQDSRTCSDACRIALWRWGGALNDEDLW